VLSINLLIYYAPDREEMDHGGEMLRGGGDVAADGVMKEVVESIGFGGK
jgi:hypothetical protein